MVGSVVQQPSADGATNQERAFNQYVMPEIDVLYRVAMSITRNQADAQDLVQDTLLRAYRGAMQTLSSSTWQR